MSAKLGIYLEKLYNDKIIVIVGPTASGKSDLAQAIALKIDGEVVSADSMQIYRGLDIGTGKVVKSEQLVPHHMIDILDPNESYSAALFQKDARHHFEDIKSRGKIPILAGGTGFYIRSAIDDYNFSEGAQVENHARHKFEQYVVTHSKADAWHLLKERDELSASVIEMNDTKRVIRALELNDRGESYFENKKALSQISEKYDSIWIGLSVDRELLAKRISRRVDNMVNQGLVREVQGLLEAGFRDALCSPKAIGYREIVSYLDNKCSLEMAITNIKTNSRRYAKRQRTWFRSEKRINWIDANSANLDELVKQAFEVIAM